MELVNLIKEKFEDTPSDLDGIRELLAQRKFTAEELAEIAVGFTDECFCEYHDALDPEIESVTIENMHSNYVFDAINLLLEVGLDPNTVVNDDNALIIKHKGGGHYVFFFSRFLIGQAYASVIIKYCYQLI